jgi:hypothetical protein
MTKPADCDPKPGKSASREKRLAAALRENLRRRKAQARGRETTTPAALETKDGKDR